MPLDAVKNPCDGHLQPVAVVAEAQASTARAASITKYMKNMGIHQGDHGVVSIENRTVSKDEESKDINNLVPPDVDDPSFIEWFY